jgi:hypothetical protein
MENEVFSDGGIIWRFITSLVYVNALIHFIYMYKIHTHTHTHSHEYSNISIIILLNNFCVVI